MVRCQDWTVLCKQVHLWKSFISTQLAFAGPWINQFVSMQYLSLSEASEVFWTEVCSGICMYPSEGGSNKPRSVCTLYSSPAWERERERERISKLEDRMLNQNRN